MNKAYTFYLMVNLLQHREQDPQMWNEGMIRYGMQEIERVNRRCNEDIESWGMEDTDVVSLLAGNDFIGLAEKLLRTVLYA